MKHKKEVSNNPPPVQTPSTPAAEASKDKEVKQFAALQCELYRLRAFRANVVKALGYEEET